MAVAVKPKVPRKTKPKLTKLDIACGQRKTEGFTGIDIAAIDGVDIVHDLNVFPWPLEDNSVGEAVSSHYLEHTPMYRPDGQDGLIATMNEVGRILAPGGTIKIVTPFFKNERAFQDPTHRRFITPTTWHYFNQDWLKMQGLDHYPITCDLEVIQMGWSYSDQSMMSRAQEFVQRAVNRDWDVVADLHVELRKK